MYTVRGFVYTVADQGVADIKTLGIVLVALVALAAGVVTSAHAQTLLLTLDTPHPQADAWFGSLLAVGDVNADSKADLVVGAQHEDVGGNDDQGRTYVFSSPPVPVGGIAELPDVPDSSAPNHIALAGLAAGVLVALSASAWYTRSRWLR